MADQVTGQDVARVAAALLRMQAHTLDSEADLKRDMAERLREQADRVEHGGELPNLRIAEDREEETVELPRIELAATTRPEGEPVFLCENGEALPRAAQGFMDTLNEVYTSHPRFVEMWNEIAAGRPPSVTTGLRLTGAIRELS